MATKKSKNPLDVLDTLIATKIGLTILAVLVIAYTYYFLTMSA